MSDADGIPALPPPGQALPGPHPHDMDPEELRVAAGDDRSVPDGYEAPDLEGGDPAAADPHASDPGPHPHEAADHRRLAGDLKTLPEGVEPYQPAEITDAGQAPPPPER